MSVTLKEYCETSQSKFAEALRVALRDVVFIDSDELNFEEVSGKVRASIKVMYNWTMFDVKHLFDAFNDFYWSIEPTNEIYSFEIVVHLKSSMI